MRAIGRYTLFLLVLLGLILATPMFYVKSSALLPIVFAPAVLALILWLGIERRWWLPLSLSAAVTVALSGWIAVRDIAVLDPAHALLLGSRYVSGALFYGAAAISVMRRLFLEKNVTADTIIGGATVYLLLGLFWALLYHLAALGDPHAFSREAAELDTFQLAYFSYITLTTVGYGDIFPSNRFAGVLSVLEAIAGQFYLAVFVARLVGLHMSSSKRS